jgi:subtilisin family serine protease
MSFKPSTRVVLSVTVLSILTVAVLSLLGAPPARSAPRRAKMDSILQRLVEGKGVGLDGKGGRAKIGRDELRMYARTFAIDVEADRPTAGVRMRLDAGARAAIESLGIKTYGNLDGFASATIPIDRLAEVAGVAGVERMQLRAIPKMELDLSVPDIGADVAWSAYNAHGEGVIVGVIDSGVDVTHPDFQDTDGTTRLLMFWNQDDTCTGTPPPPPYDFGCLYTQAEIQDHIDGITPIDVLDADGHGTLVAGTMAGDGSHTGNGQPAFQYVGPANRADLIVVKIFPESGSSCTTCGQSALAAEFIADMAASLGQPYAINMSFGSQYGSHDGFDIDEQTIDTLTGPGIPGGVVVKSAGNDGGSGLHESGTVAAGGTNNHTFTIPVYTPLPGTFNDLIAINLWYQGGDSFTVTTLDPVTTPCTGAQSYACSTGTPFDGVGTTSGVILCDAPSGPEPNGDRFMDLEVDDQLGVAPCRGVWTVRVRGDVITQGGHYDLYIWFSSFGANQLFADWDSPDHSQVISMPGTANHVTTVGAYKTKQSWTSVDGDPISWTDPGLVGNIASFSSNGPTRDGRLKPEITAPGFGVAGPLSINVPPSQVGPTGANRALVQQDGVHWILAGTSFSSPHVAGVYAQLLGANPTLDAIDLRTLITTAARTDAFTEAPTPTPNNLWGHGKLDVPGAFESLIKAIPDLMMSDSIGSWSGIATADTYNVYRADSAALDGTFYGNCLQMGLPTPGFTDPDLPPDGVAWVYHVTGVKDGVEGLIRMNPDGTTVLPSNPCI